VATIYQNHYGYIYYIVDILLRVKDSMLNESHNYRKLAVDLYCKD